MIQQLAILSLGFVIGMGHALETDHMAAMSNMLTRKGSRITLIMRGAYWGLGHTFSLFIICSSVVILGLSISGGVQAGLEFIVGAMIVALGIQTLWRMHKERVHAHIHQHGEAVHLHLHSHAGEDKPHRNASHDHEHRRSNYKALAIGLVHGVAGSGALLVLTVSTAQSIWQALIYFAVFGVGSMFGMAALSAVVCLPLALAQRGTVWVRNGTTGLVGCAALYFGAVLMFENGATLQRLLQ